MSNRSVGTGFEREFCGILAKHGFWAHNMAQKAEGQPADVVAAKDGTAFLIDCKVCEKDVFRLDRVEENQELAMGKWLGCGNLGAYFAIKLLTTGEIFMVPFQDIRGMRLRNVKTLKRKDLIMYTTLEMWMRNRQ